MLNRIREAKKNEKGFTLIELLIVIVILGILAAIVVFAVGGITDRGNVSACKADYKTAEVAVEAFKAQSATASYPASLAVLVPTFLRETHVDGANGYTIGYTAATGAVTATGVCTIP